MRSGPHPLHMHLSLASSVLPDDEGRALALYKMVQGIQRYQQHSYKPQRSDRSCVWKNGATSLFQMHTDARGGEGTAPILLIPSLINRSSILDLTKEQSFAGWLVQQGHPVYLLDWGDVCGEARAPTLEDIIGTRLGEALKFVRNTDGKKVHLLGYCMGGTLSMAAPVLWPELVETLTLLAAPWDMHAGENSLGKSVQFWSGSVVPTIQTKGYLPAGWLQGLFASLDPEMTLHKFSSFADMAEGSRDEKIFIAVEDWLNDGRDLPGDIAQICIIDWFIKNITAQNEWRVCETLIRPEAVHCPVLVVASKRDRLVVYDSAVAPLETLPKAQHIAPDCGHIGMMAGRKAETEVWQKISAWWSERG